MLYSERLSYTLCLIAPTVHRVLRCYSKNEHKNNAIKITKSLIVTSNIWNENEQKRRRFQL